MATIEAQQRSHPDRTLAAIAASQGTPPLPELDRWNHEFYKDYPTPEEIYELWKQKLRGEKSFDGKSLGQLLLDIDFTSGDNDEIHRGALKADKDIEIADKLAITNRLAEAVFSTKQENSSDKTRENRIGEFLKTATEIYKKEGVGSNEEIEEQQQLKNQFYNLLTPELLEEVRLETSKNRWNMENREAAMHAYCNFLTIERLKGEKEARDIYRKLAKMFITAKEVDVWGNRVGKVATGEKRGTAIYLSPNGQNMAECVAQLAFTHAREEMEQEYGENEGVMSGYYRNWNILTNLGDESDDPKGRLTSIDQALAELGRLEGAPGGGGIDLPAKGHVIDKDGKLTILRGKAHVGGNVLHAVGNITGRRLRRIHEKGIVYAKPQRAEKTREIQLDYSGVAGLVIGGDGAIHHVNEGLEYAALYNTPAVFLVLNNEVAIGAKLPEYTAETELWKKGHGKRVPGIRIGKTDPDQLYLMTRFLICDAYWDNGPSIIEAMVARLDAHSVQHGDATTVEYIFKAKEILEKQIALLSAQDPKAEEIRKYIDNTLTKYNQSVNQLTVVERLIKLLTETDFVNDEGVKTDIQKIIDEIVDPAAVALKDWQEKGYITPQEVKQWRHEEKERLAKITEEVLARPRPDPKKATMHIRFPAKKIERPYAAEKITAEGNSEALSLSILKALENPYFLAGGVDLVKGLDLHDGKFTYSQLYYKEARNSYEKFGHIPMKVFDIPIYESANMKFVMGMATTRTDEESLKRAWRFGLFQDYGDYAYEAIVALHILANEYYGTAGELTNLTTLVMNSGAVPGGGFMHSHEMAGKMFQANHSVYIAYTSDPESTYKVGNYFFNESNNPNVFIIDKKGMFEPTVTFEKGTGVCEPGEGRLVKEGKGTQIISYGPMVNTFKNALESPDVLPRFTESTGLYDIRWIQPIPYDGLGDFLSDGTGPIIVASEEPIGVTPNKKGSDELDPVIKGFGAQIISLLTTDPQMKEIMQGRPIIPVGSKPVPAPPCDAILMNAVIPTVEDAKHTLVEANRMDRQDRMRAHVLLGDIWGHERRRMFDRFTRRKAS